MLVLMVVPPKVVICHRLECFAKDTLQQQSVPTEAQSKQLRLLGLCKSRVFLGQLGKGFVGWCKCGDTTILRDLRRKICKIEKFQQHTEVA